MATKSANKIELKGIKETAKKANDFILNTTEMIVDETIDRTYAWQHVAEKAINGGFKLVEKQTDITFKVFETLKKQWIKGQKNYQERVKN